MQIRKLINNLRFTAPVLIVIIAAVAWNAVRSMPNRQIPLVVTKAYFTDDDGRTWFVDNDDKIPPFDHDGKVAVMAFVYQTAHGTQFVQHLQKYPAAVKANAESAGNTEAARALVAGATPLVKKPGDATWISQSDPRAISILSIAAVVQDKGPVTPVFP